MDRQIIEISNNGFFLSLYRGFLVIENEKKQKQEITRKFIFLMMLCNVLILFNKKSSQKFDF